MIGIGISILFIMVTICILQRLFFLCPNRKRRNQNSEQGVGTNTRFQSPNDCREVEVDPCHMTASYVPAHDSPSHIGFQEPPRHLESPPSYEESSKFHKEAYISDQLLLNENQPMINGNTAENSCAGPSRMSGTGPSGTDPEEAMPPAYEDIVVQKT